MEYSGVSKIEFFTFLHVIFLKKMLRAIGGHFGPPAASSFMFVKVSLVARVKLAKKGAPCCVVKCGWNKLVVAYGKVGYLTPIVRSHIKKAHPKPAPLHTQKGGSRAVTVLGNVLHKGCTQTSALSAACPHC